MRNLIILLVICLLAAPVYGKRKKKKKKRKHKAKVERVVEKSPDVVPEEATSADAAPPDGAPIDSPPEPQVVVPADEPVSDAPGADAESVDAAEAEPAGATGPPPAAGSEALGESSSGGESIDATAVSPDAFATPPETSLSESPSPETDAGAAATGGAFLVGVKAGGLIPFSGLGVSPGGTLELGWVLPIANRGVGVLVGVSYAQPTASGSGTDPRVAGGSYTWELTQQTVAIAPTFLYRYSAGLGPLVPYVGVGPRIYYFRTTVTGTAGGQDMPETREQIGWVGVGLPVGVELALGPGSLTFDLLYEWSKIDNRSAGSDARLNAMSAHLGYRLLL